MDYRTRLEDRNDLLKTYTTQVTYTAGHAIGIIAVDLIYPKLPGNVANATTFDFPVLYEVVNFDIEKLFKGDASIKEQVVNAAKTLEKKGVRAIVGACGYFAHFQDDVKNAVNVPVFLSSLCQLPFIKLGIGSSKKIAVIAASGDDINDELLLKVGSSKKDILIKNIGKLPSFAPIRYGKTTLDNRALTEELTNVVRDFVAQNEDIGAILLECSDLPPYARSIQSATGLAVFDFITMINMVYHSVVQKTYFGYF